MSLRKFTTHVSQLGEPYYTASYSIDTLNSTGDDDHIAHFEQLEVCFNDSETARIAANHAAQQWISSHPAPHDRETATRRNEKGAL